MNVTELKEKTRRKTTVLVIQTQDRNILQSSYGEVLCNCNLLLLQIILKQGYKYLMENIYMQKDKRDTLVNAE